VQKKEKVYRVILPGWRTKRMADGKSWDPIVWCADTLSALIRLLESKRKFDEFEVERAGSTWSLLVRYCNTWYRADNFKGWNQADRLGRWMTERGLREGEVVNYEPEKAENPEAIRKFNLKFYECTPCRS